MKKSSNKKVISKKKNKKNVSTKENILKRFINRLKTNRKYMIILSIVIVCLIGLVIFIPSVIRKNSLNKVVLTIDDMEYTKSDFNIYFYSVKYDYFGSSAGDVSDDNMKAVIDNEEGTTLGQYLKDQALTEIKTATVIREYALKNNIELDDKDYQELKKNKKKYIKKLGGKGKFKKLLRDNDTTDKSYDSMAETDKLYNKLLTKVYGEGRKKDLTDDELNEASKTYKTKYFKVEQIILTTIDVETGKSLSDTTINQKKMLADTIYALANEGKDFEKLVSKYSEDAQDKEPPYYEYYKSGELLKQIEEAVLKLEDNAISPVIQTDYAFHIIKKLELDDSKYNKYLDELREEKALKDLNDSLGSLKIIYRDAYKKIKY